MKQKICAILILIMLLLNSSVMIVIAESVDAVNEIVDSATQRVTTVSNVDLMLNAEYLVNNVENKVELTATLKTDDTKYSLFKNPSISIEMPAEIVDVILEEPYLMYNNKVFTIKSSELTTNENGNKVINVQLEGEQTEYETNSILEGTNIVIPARLVVSKQIDTTIANIKLTYTNENECHTIYEAAGDDCETQEIMLINKIVRNLPAITSEEEAKTLEFEQDGIKVEIIEKVGNTVIPNNGTLYEQQIVKHIVRFTNVSDVVQPVNFVVTIPEELTYLEFYPQEIIHNEEYDAYYINKKPAYIYDLDKKQINISTEQLDIEETLETYVEFRVEYLQDVSEQIISIDYDFIKNDGTVSEYNISNTINEAEIETFLDCLRLNDRADWQYSLSVTNATDRTLTNVNILAEIDKGFNISEIYRLVLETGDHEFFDLSNVQENNFIYPIDKIEPGECYKIMVDGNTKDIYEDEEENTYEMKGVFKVYGDEINTYVSNETSVTAGIEKIKVSMTSDKDGQELKTDDEITYTINIQNIGNEKLAMSKYSNVKLTNFIPEEFQPISATYNNFVVETQYIEEIRDYVSAPLKVETYSEVQKNVDLTYKEVPDGMAAEDVPNLELYLSIPYGEKITIEVKAKVKMVLEKEDITNEVTVGGKDMLTKKASATNTLLPYNYDETQEPTDPEDPEKPGDNGGGTITDPEQPEIPENPGENVEVKVTGVELIPSETTLKIGQSAQLIANVLPNNASNKAVTWSSSDESVAIVINGNVMALKEGTATITVTTEDGNKTATSIITVENINIGESEVPVTGIQITPTSSTILVGKTVKLRTAIIPSSATNQKVIWSSDNEQVATVDENGLVTGIKEGKTTITVTTEDGNKTATCEITVQNIDEETEPTDPEEPQEPSNPEGPQNPIDPEEPQEPTDPEKPEDPETPQDPEKPEEEKMTVSGTAWIDTNENGKREAEEPLYSNMTVMLYNYKTKKLVSVDGVAIEKKTDENGKYEFTDLEKGKYIVIFWYDANKYELTKYQKTGVSNSENSDAVSKNVTLMGEKKLAGLTDIITVNQNVSNIDIGLVENKEFDFSIQKYISKITIQTSKETKTYTYNNKNFAKVEIHSKEINGSQVIIEYKMVVKNEGELPGRVDLIVDNVPNDLNFYSELNSNWYKSKDGICTTALSGETIGVGESREVTIVLTKNMSGNNVGAIENTARIGLTSNEKAIEEKNLENNSAKAEVLVTISTGIIKWIGLIIGIIAVLGIMAYIVIKDKKLIKTITFIFLIFIILVGNTGQVFAASMSQEEAKEEWSKDTSEYPVTMPDGTTKRLRCVTPEGTMCGSGAAYHIATLLRQTEILGTRVTTSTGDTNIPANVEFTLADGTTQSNVGVTITSSSIKVGPFKINALRGTTSASDVKISSCKVTYNVMEANGTITTNKELDITSTAKLGQDFYIELPLGTTQITKINVNAGCSYSATTSSTVKYRFYYKITAVDGSHRYSCIKATNTPDKWNFMQTLAEDKTVTENESIDKSCQKSLEIPGPWVIPGNLSIEKLAYDDEDGVKTYIPNIGIKILKGTDQTASKYMGLYDANGNIAKSVSIGETFEFTNYKAYDDASSTVVIDGTTYTAKWNATKANATELILKTGKVTLKNIAASTTYTIIETSNPNYGYDTDRNKDVTKSIQVKPGNNTNLVQLYNRKSTGGLVIRKVDEDNNNVLLPNVEFVLKSKKDSTEQGYLKIIADDSSNVKKFANSDYAEYATGWVKIKDSASPIQYVKTPAEATKFITDSNGTVTITNLPSTYVTSSSTPAEDGPRWYYKAEEYWNPHYGYSKESYHENGLTKYIAEDTSAWAVDTKTGWKLLPTVWVSDTSEKDHQYGTAYRVTLSNKKLTGNIYINKYDAEGGTDVKLQNIGFVLKADLLNDSNDKFNMNGKYIKVKISQGSHSDDSEGYANYTQGNVRIADGGFTGSSSDVIKYVDDPSQATVFYTNENGEILISNILQSTNGTNSIRYKLEEYDSKVYGYVAEIGEGCTNATAVFANTSKVTEDGYVTITRRTSNVTKTNTPTATERDTVDIMNYKQTGNLEIYKIDNDTENKLPKVSFVLKTKVEEDGELVERYIKAVVEGKDVSIDKNGYATQVNGDCRIKDITNSINNQNELTSLKFVKDKNEATKFTTDFYGRIRILNLVMSTNGKDKIPYYLEEIGNNNYGYAGVSNKYTVVYETDDGWFNIEKQKYEDTLIIENGNNTNSNESSNADEEAYKDVGKEYKFKYQNKIQVFTAPHTGEYQLEVWGASGGTVTTDGKQTIAEPYNGGNGGYSVGTITLTKGDTLYIGVGGQGKEATVPGESIEGGFNGGGAVEGSANVNHVYGSGGGATHIAKANNRGELKNYKNNKDEILIVAGGGGGARNQENHSVDARWGHGGAGGGTSGQGAISSNGSTTEFTTLQQYAGTQNRGYTFGQGGNGSLQAGGGGGFYGGHSGNKISESEYPGSGSGGSGYISSELNSGYTRAGTSEVPNYAYSGNMVGNKGDGYAKITYIKAVPAAQPTYIPEGYTHVIGTTMSNGYVVKDNVGNEFVWIDVPRTSTVYKTAGLYIAEFTDAEYSKIEKDLHTYTSVYREEPAYIDEYSGNDNTTGLTNSEYINLKKKMLKSIYKNGGFYVGRYETGIANSYRTENSITPTETPVIKANAYPYNRVTAKEAQNLASSMATNGHTTSLMFGVQWDLIMKYLETKGVSQEEIKKDSTAWGNYANSSFNITNKNAKYGTEQGNSWTNAPYGEKSADKQVLLTTGASEQFKKQNIYDLAGNVWEWTLEYTSDVKKPVCYRGGNYLHSGQVYQAGVHSRDEIKNYGNLGFRVSLYKTEIENTEFTKKIVKNIKQTMNLKIHKSDIDSNNTMERVTFVLKASVNDGQFANKYIRIIPDDGSNLYAVSVVGNVRISDKVYTENDSSPSVDFVDKIEDATNFITDSNGQIAITNLIMSTNGENRIQYTPIEIKNDHYGYVADGTNTTVRFQNETRENAYKEIKYVFNRQSANETTEEPGNAKYSANITVKNIKQTGNLYVNKGDYEQYNNKKLEKVTFIIKAQHTSEDINGKYIKILPDGSDKYASTVNGTVRVQDIVYDKEHEQNKAPLLFVNKNNATKFVTDANGKIIIMNLLMNTNGTESGQIKYSFVEVANDNYGYVADGSNTTLVSNGQYTIPIQPSTETSSNATTANKQSYPIVLKNMKQTGNLQIKKVDFDDESILTEEVTFAVKAHLDGNKSIDKKYIKIIADTSEGRNYLETAKGTVRIKDQCYNYENPQPSVVYVDNYDEATKFITDSDGQITIMNLIMTTNGNDRIKYTFEELKNDNYGYVAEEGNNNNYTLRYPGQDINVKEEQQQAIERQSSVETLEQADKVQQITLRNIKQTGNLVITKVDSRDTNEKLANVEFVLKAKTTQDNEEHKTHESNQYYNIDDKYVKATTETLQDGGVRITGISFVDTINDATKFKTDEQGKLIIYNLLMSTNGANRIAYHLIETKNPNYGYLASADKFEDFKISLEGPSVNGDDITVERQTKQETDGKTSENDTIVIVKNEQVYTRLSGMVWEDIVPGKSNTKTDSLYKESSDDALIEGIEVFLYKNGEFVTKTKTDKNGYYMFGTLKDGEYTNSDYWGDNEPTRDEENNSDKLNSNAQNENGNIVIDDIDQYHIEFEYDGLRFTTVQPFAKDGESNAEPINSKGKEVVNGHKDNKDRKTVDESFTTVYGGSNEGNIINGSAGLTNEEETKTYDLQYTPIISETNGNRSEYIDHWEYSEYLTNENGKKYIKSTNTYGHYPIVSSINEIKWDDKYAIDDTIPYMNQGLYRRELPDLAINSDIEKVEIIVDGYKNTYKYAKRGISDTSDGAESDGYGVDVKYGTSMGSYSSRGLNTYTRPLYASDLAYSLANKDSKEIMQVFITYHISVKNNSDTLKTRINEIVNYYDSRYENAAAVGATIIKDEQTNDAAFKKLTLNVDQTMNAGAIYNDIYITFKMNKEAVLEIANERATLHNITEITSFTAFYGQGTYYAEYQEYQSSGDDDRKVYAGIDKDSAPGSAKIFVADRIDGTTMMDINGDGNEYEYSTPILELSSEAIKTFEDDTTRAPSLILGIESADPTRGLSGVVFEDNADFSTCTDEGHHATGIHTNETRLGNGIYDEGENLIKNAKVELYNVDETTGDAKSEVATLYRLEIHDGKAEAVPLEATTWSGELDESKKYNYRLMGVTPGKYLLRYSYGKLEQATQIIQSDGTVKDLSAIDYKSTIITSEEVKNALNLFANPDRLGNINWVLIEEKDAEGKIIRYSDATDDLSLRNQEDEEVYYGKEEIAKIMTADTAVFEVGIEFAEVTNGEEYKESTTEYDDEFILIDENEDGTYDKIVRNPQFDTINPYQDFGIIERAIPDAYVHKTVSHMRLVSGQGQGIINGKPFEESLKYVKALEWNRGLKEDNERTISIEVDNEIYPANLYLEYAITAYNNSELDYKFNDEIGKKFYFFGISEDENGNKATPIDETIVKVVDYMDAELKFDIEKSNDETKNGEWTVVTLDQLSGKFISPEVEEELKKNGYTMLVTTAFSGLKSGESKTIYAYAEKLVAADADEITFDNHVEIIHTKGLRTINNATPGNYIPSIKPDENEQDDDWIKIVMAPPTGLPISKIYQ